MTSQNLSVDVFGIAMLLVATRDAAVTLYDVLTVLPMHKRYLMNSVALHIHHLHALFLEIATHYYTHYTTVSSHTHNLSADIAQCLPSSVIFLKTSPVGSIMNGDMISDGWSAFFMNCCPGLGLPQMSGTLKVDDGAPGVKPVMNISRSWSIALGGACISIIGRFGNLDVTPTFKPPTTPYKTKSEGKYKVFVLTDMLAAHTSNVDPSKNFVPHKQHSSPSPTFQLLV